MLHYQKQRHCRINISKVFLKYSITGTKHIEKYFSKKQNNKTKNILEKQAKNIQNKIKKSKKTDTHIKKIIIKILFYTYYVL